MAGLLLALKEMGMGIVPAEVFEAEHAEVERLKVEIERLRAGWSDYAGGEPVSRQAWDELVQARNDEVQRRLDADQRLRLAAVEVAEQNAKIQDLESLAIGWELAAEQVIKVKLEAAEQRANLNFTRAVEQADALAASDALLRRLVEQMTQLHHVLRAMGYDPALEALMLLDEVRAHLGEGAKT